MPRRSTTVWIIVILTVLIATGTILTTAAAQKASVPKVQDTLAMGEEEVKHLLLLIHPSKEGKISKQEYMKFVEAEFDRLDKERKGELDIRILAQSNLSASRHAGK